MKKSTLFLLLILGLPCLAQKQYNIWNIGRDGVGLDFNCIPPSIIEGHQMIGWEGTCTVSDPETGKLLFYTNGDKVYNRNNQVIPGADHITPVSEFFEPFNSNTQVLAVPRPNHPGEWYVINGDAQGGKIQSGNPTLNGVWAVHLDMNANDGLGEGIDEIQLHNPLFSSEKLTAILHENGTDIWVIGHEFGNSNFWVSQLTENGFQPTPDIYDIGVEHVAVQNDFDNINALGELKPSPDGTLLASVISLTGTIEIFDFDKSTGAISNVKTIGAEPGAFGLSFSPDNSKLYVSTYEGDLFQFDVSLGSEAEIVASKTLIYNYNGGSFASLKIGPDFKIYVSRFTGGVYAQDGGDTFLGVINEPNELGLNCNYEHDGISLNGKKCNWGLNNVMEIPTYEQIELSVDLGGAVGLFCIAGFADLDATQECVQDYLWSTGETTPAIQATEGGTYWVEISYGNCSASDTVEVISESIDENVLPDDISGCQDDNITLEASFPLGDFLWSDGSTENTLEVNQTGTYWVDVQIGSCTVSDTVNVFIENIEPFSFGEDQTLCEGEELELQIPYQNAFVQWQDGSIGNTFVITEPGEYFAIAETDCSIFTDTILISNGGSDNLDDFFKMPNAFTPNGDNINDIFRPAFPEDQDLSNIQNFELAVFNRWGQEVFYSDNPQNGWNGLRNEKNATNDVFIWRLKAQLISCKGESIIISDKGNLSLLR